MDNFNTSHKNKKRKVDGIFSYYRVGMKKETKSKMLKYYDPNNPITKILLNNHCYNSYILTYTAMPHPHRKRNAQ